MSRRSPRPLPGVRFETVAPPAGDELPRMDIAVLVGFAASGPLHVPVAVEDPVEFAAIFGEDAPLAWDPALGEATQAHLGPSVRAFFRNGGRRCWVIRVANPHATSNRFPLPGLLKRTSDGMRPAFAFARSEGSWSDPLRAGCALTPQAIGFRSDATLDLTQLRVTFVLASRGALSPGDLVRASFDDGSQLLFTIDKLAAGGTDASGGAQRSLVTARGRNALWLVPLPPLSSRPALAAAYEARLWKGPTDAQSITYPVLSVPALDGSGRVSVRLDLGAPPSPEPGSFLRIRWGTNDLWLVIEGLATPSDSTAGVLVTGTALLPSTTAPTPLPVPRRFEQLRFELRVRRGDEDAIRLDSLAFDPIHSNDWASLPTDGALFGPEPAGQTAAHDSDPPYAALRAHAARPRFPLAGDDLSASYVPLGMPLLGTFYLPPWHENKPSLERDGVVTAPSPPAPVPLDAALFLDGDLRDATALALPAAADFILYQSNTPRPLRGIHAAWDLAEAALIAVPDAVHPSFVLSPVKLPPAAPPSEKIQQPPWGQFLDCARHPLAAPTLSLVAGPDASGSFTLAWTSPLPKEAGGVEFTVEEATEPDWAAAVTLYQGSDLRRAVYGRSHRAAYYYRVYAQAGPNRSEWSAGLTVVMASETRWEVSSAHFNPSALLAIQEALLRLCAARGDLFAALDLPAHDREDDAIAHAGVLTGKIASALASDLIVTGPADLTTLSHGALYHPWVMTAGRLDGSVATLPPSGAMLGVMAARALARGAWIAPANEVLSGVVALFPPIARERRLDLSDAGINLIRQEPRGFLTLSAATLSDDEDLVPINVRRLLSLLRRVAQRVGPRYVFEPNNGAFRRRVQRSFESTLDLLHRRGAFAGIDPSTSFQVVVSETANTAKEADLGRFTVEVKVAPSLPLAFLTIRLLQSGDRSLITEVR